MLLYKIYNSFIVRYYFIVAIMFYSLLFGLLGFFCLNAVNFTSFAADITNDEAKEMQTILTTLKEAYKARDSEDYAKCATLTNKYFASDERQSQEDLKIMHDMLTCYQNYDAEKFFDFSIAIFRALQNNKLKEPRQGTKAFYTIVKNFTEKAESTKSIDQIERLKGLFETDAQFLSFKAKSLLKFGKYSEATDVLKACLLINITSPSCQKNLAIAHDLLNEKSKATDFYKIFYNDNCLVNTIANIGEADATKELNTKDCTEVKKRLNELQN